MIVPVRTTPIARTLASSRVRRRRGLRTVAADVIGEGLETADSPAPCSDFVVLSTPRLTSSRPTAAFLASLLMLRRGG